MASAKGLKRMIIKLRRDGSVRFRMRGRQLVLSGLRPGMAHVTVGFRDAASGDAQNMCSTTARVFRPARKGTLRTP